VYDFILDNVSSVWDVTIAGPATVPSVVVISFSFSEAVHTTMYKTRQAVPVECLDMVTVPTDPFSGPTAPFLSEWAQCRRGNIQNGGTVFPIANLVGDIESGSQDTYSSFLVTIRLSRLV